MCVLNNYEFLRQYWCFLHVKLEVSMFMLLFILVLLYYKRQQLAKKPFRLEICMRILTKSTSFIWVFVLCVDFIKRTFELDIQLTFNVVNWPIKRGIVNIIIFKTASWENKNLTAFSSQLAVSYQQIKVSQEYYEKVKFCWPVLLLSASAGIKSVGDRTF